MVEWRRRRIPAADAIGRVSAETIGCYPPGWPILVAGERITPEAVTYLRRAAEAGGHLKRGVQEHPFRTIEVIDMPCTPGDELLPESPGVTLLL
jgi:lysine decarboxylase